MIILYKINKNKESGGNVMRRNRDNKDFNYVPERNGVTGFTLTGFLLFIGLIIIISVINYFFF